LIELLLTASSSYGVFFYGVNLTVTAYSIEPKKHLNKRLELRVKCGRVYKYREAGLTVM